MKIINMVKKFTRSKKNHLNKLNQKLDQFIEIIRQ